MAKSLGGTMWTSDDGKETRLEFYDDGTLIHL
jgi:hypothetical protein